MIDLHVLIKIDLFVDGRVLFGIVINLFEYGQSE